MASRQKMNIEERLKQIEKDLRLVKILLVLLLIGLWPFLLLAAPVAGAIGLALAVLFVGANYMSRHNERRIDEHVFEEDPKADR